MFTMVVVFSGFALRLQIVESSIYPKAFLSDLAFVAVFTALGFLLNRRRRPIYYVAFSCVVSVLLLLDTIYFRTNGSILSLFLAPQIEFFPQVVGAAASMVHMSDAVYLVGPVALIAGVIALRRRGYFERTDETGWDRRQKAITSLVVALLIFGGFALFMTKTEESRLTKHWNRPYLVEHFGVYSYHLSDLIKFSASSPGGSEIEAGDFARVTAFFAGSKAGPRPTNSYTGVLAGQNVILIHGESVEAMFLFSSIEGHEITPNLNRLAREGLYFEKFYSQQSAGTSSDSEFTFNTSLYPINNGTVFISHFNNTFVSLPDELRRKGYTTLAAHGNDGDFWNRAIMNKTLGYDRFLSKKDFEIDEVIGMGLSDMSFFKQGAEVLDETKQPFYALFITLTNHTPFEETDSYGEFAVGEFEGVRFGNYMKSLHYADRAIGRFIDDLDRRGLLENTTIVVYGDHPASLDTEQTQSFLGLESFDRFDEKRAHRIPLIIWSPAIEEPAVISRPMGMIDVMPTLGNMLGVRNEYAFGHDIFAVDRNRVAFPDGSWLDENIIYDSTVMEYKVFGRALLNQYIETSKAKVHPMLRGLGETDVDLAPGNVSAFNGIPRDRIFEYQPGHEPSKGLSKYVYQHVNRVTQEVAAQLEISDLILEYDLLRPPGENHRESLASRR